MIYFAQALINATISLVFSASAAAIGFVGSFAALYAVAMAADWFTGNTGGNRPSVAISMLSMAVCPAAAAVAFIVGLVVSARYWQ